MDDRSIDMLMNLLNGYVMMPENDFLHMHEENRRLEKRLHQYERTTAVILGLLVLRVICNKRKKNKKEDEN